MSQVRDALLQNCDGQSSEEGQGLNLLNYGLDRRFPMLDYANFGHYGLEVQTTKACLKPLVPFDGSSMGCNPSVSYFDNSIFEKGALHHIA